jgi:hypothetical protein
VRFGESMSGKALRALAIAWRDVGDATKKGSRA